MLLWDPWTVVPGFSLDGSGMIVLVGAYSDAMAVVSGKPVGAENPSPLVAGLC
jgi:hypothetical protein